MAQLQNLATMAYLDTMADDTRTRLLKRYWSPKLEVETPNPETIKRVIRDELFPRVKFLNHRDMFFSTNERTICGIILGRLKGSIESDQSQERQMLYWEKVVKPMLPKTIGRKRNNMVRRIKDKYRGEEFGGSCRLATFG